MSQKVRNLIIGLVILVVLGGALALLMLTQGDGQGDDVSSEPPYAVDSIKLVDKKPENITSIQVKNKEDSYTISRDKDKQFTIDKLNGFDQTSETMDVTAVRAAAMSATKEVETTLDNQKKYGLDAPQAEVTVTFDDKSEFTFYLGNQAPSDKGYYLKVKGKESVYIATENMAGNFLQPSRYYVDLTINHVEDTNDWLGRDIRVRVIEADMESGKLVLSAREILREETAAARKAQREVAIAQIAVGSIVEGTVESIQSYGAFIDLGNNVTGLVHISQISQEHIKSPKEVLEIGQAVRARVIKNEGGKISLSIKELLEEERIKEEEEIKRNIPEVESVGTSLAELLRGLKLD